MTEVAIPALEEIEHLIAARRTSLLVDRDRPVPTDLLERLSSLIFAAPNHKRTRPWQVCILTGEARAALGAAFVEDMVSAAARNATSVPEAKADKTRTKYLRAPAIVLVGCAPSGEQLRHSEDLHSVAAGVENLLLGAVAAGLAAMWSSPPVTDGARVAGLAGFAPGTELVAVIYLGYPTASPPTAERAPVTVTWRDSA